jgi:hypothetical protein
MLELLETSDDVVALTVSGKLTRAELTPVMDRLEQAMSRHDKVHVFVETRDLDGFELADLPSYLKDALPMFKKLDRFGRVAIVADQTWVRAASRLESAVLPGITYRVFEPDEREEALSWVLQK